MPTPTYTPLANITLGSSAASVTFSAFASGYRDLVIVAMARDTYAGTGNDSIDIRFNSDTGGNYNLVRMFGVGSGSGSSSSSPGATAISAGRLNEGNTTANVFSSNVIQIMDAFATDKHKSVVSRADVPDQSTFAFAGRWASTAAITSIQLYNPNSNFAAGSTFALYGIAA